MDFEKADAKEAKRFAVVGSGPAGLAFATTAAARGHKVVMFEAESQIGGQLNLARLIPGKAEFNEMIHISESGSSSTASKSERTPS